MSDTLSRDGAVARIRAAAWPDDLETVRRLFLEYQDWLDVDLCFQDFDEELASLPGRYAAPTGGLWLAHVDAEPAGVVGLRAIAAPGDCEMKRLWVRPDHRSHGLGLRLVETCVATARRTGYQRLRLDTLPQMGAAHALYARLGFRETPPYYDNPIPGAAYLQLDL